MINRQIAHNPYTNMLANLDPAHFYGREHMARSILDGIRRPSHASYMIRGFKAVGKTSLWHYIVHLAQNGRNGSLFAAPPIFVYVNFYTTGLGPDWNLAQVCQTIYAQLIADPNLPDDLAPQAAGVQGGDESNVWPARLVTLALDVRIRKRLPVICLDHFDRVVQGLTSDVESSLVRLMNNAALIMLLEKDPMTVLGKREKRSPLFQQMVPQILRFLAPDDARLLITQPAADAGVTFAADEVDFLLERAGRHPYLLTLAGEWLYGLYEHYSHGTSSAAGPFSLLATQPWQRSELYDQDRVQQALYDFWRRLSDGERLVFHAIASGAFRPVAQPPETKEEREALKGLFDKELIETSEGQYRASIGLFKDHALRADLRKTGRPLDVDELLEKLARQEYDLFSYLVEKDGEVCPTSDLYDRFWDGRPNQAALAASVSRIRTVIRENFNSEWDYIPNVRGRGYRFALPPSEAER